MSVPPGEQHFVTGAGGVRIAAYEWGNGSGPPVLFIHGFTQSHLCWHRQFTDEALLAGRRVVAMDLRGHGDSGRELPEPAAPDLPPGYAPSDFADDVQAVIDGLGLLTPVLVGWSYGGLVISDYVRTHGTSAIGGAVFAGAACRLDPPAHEDTFIGPGFFETAQDLLSGELSANIRGTHNFLNACFEVTPSPEDFAFQLAYNAMVPAANRLAMFGRPAERFDEQVLPGLDRPALVIHGEDDIVVFPGSGEAIASAIPGAELILYEQCGHAPFLEHPERFNQDLLAFLER
ncbi:MAG TPA: alpha/beta hydrolase [Solirubrobacteraceae bacterium]|jgi:pimeloyl-ACP methyl ester carboxylesterase|nr:alpha/beta hydrolase [Solirubrobacteraceae bacterium]